MARHVILGTAGHIDHGKSTLVKALTGTDPDRLKEEKERGITIDLGFADLSFPDGLAIGIIDVPGHERLVRNMLAGAGGIDLVVMVIAADEGVMPQSREHLAICNLLGIERGLVALTKTDMVEPDWVDLVKEDVRAFLKGSFLESADILPVSARSGDGLEALKTAIHDLAVKVPVKSEKGIFRLPVDRVFTLKGFGTVVTGTALGGMISVDDPVEILPSGRESRVRNLHSHGHSLTTARAGQRVAINLQGIEKTDVLRGEVVAAPGRIRPTTAIDARIKLLKDAPVLKSRSKVHFHVGTTETVARVVLFDSDAVEPGTEAFCQLRLDHPVVALSGDRFVIRRFSPMSTIGGGLVLDPSPRRRRRADGVSDLETYLGTSLPDIIEVKIRREGLNGMTLPGLEGWIKSDRPDIAAAVKKLVDGKRVLALDEHLVHTDASSVFRTRILEQLKKFHKENPMKPGMSKEELRGIFPGLPQKIFGSLLAGVREAVIEKDLVRSSGFKLALSGADEETKGKVLKQIADAGLQPPFLKELSEALSMPERALADLLRILANEGKVKRVNDSIFMSASSYEDMITRLRGFFGGKSEMTVAEFRDLLGTSRKYAMPLLEHLDAARVTLRTGDVRKFLLK